MKFQPLAIGGAYLIEPEFVTDERGFFARTYCREVFAETGLNPELRQCSISFNASRHTLRGLHYQRHPHEEAKLVRCTKGAAYHVILDLRNGSASYLKWASADLSSENRNLLYVPHGVAHGFITLRDATEIFYQMSEYYAPESAAGVRWNDPAFRISWPVDPSVISKSDSGYADFSEERRPGAPGDD